MKTEKSAGSAPASTPAATRVDYPAAHSMDSTWWAVDSQGNVARVETGEAGAMPSDASDSPAMEELIPQFAAAGVQFYCDDLFSLADGKLYTRPYSLSWDKVSDAPLESLDRERYTTGYLLWLRDEAAIQEVTSRGAVPPSRTLVQRFTNLFSPSARHQQLAPWNASRLAVPGKIVIWIDSWEQHSLPTPQRVQELLNSGAILRAWAYEPALEPERFGIFGYHLDTFDNWVAGPFERGHPPQRILQQNELPSAIRDAIQFSQLPEADFRRDMLLQPFEHLASGCWGEHWISTTGQQFRAEQHGPQLSALPSQSSFAIALPPGDSSLAALAAAYLSGEPGANQVINDFLQESGYPPLAMHQSPAKRLDELILNLFTASDRTALEAAFVEHALEVAPPPAETASTARAAIDAARQWELGKLSDEQLQAGARAALQAWIPNDGDFDEVIELPPGSAIAWAAWALARRLPLVPARTTRLTRPESLSWQAGYVLSRL